MSRRRIAGSFVNALIIHAATAQLAWPPGQDEGARNRRQMCRKTGAVIRGACPVRLTSGGSPQAAPLLKARFGGAVMTQGPTLRQRTCLERHIVPRRQSVEAFFNRRPVRRPLRRAPASAAAPAASPIRPAEIPPLSHPLRRTTRRSVLSRGALAQARGSPSRPTAMRFPLRAVARFGPGSLGGPARPSEDGTPFGATFVWCVEGI